MRLFVALNPSEGDKAVLERYIVSLRKAGAEGNFSRKENLHVTLAFIGETDRLEAAARAVGGVASEPFAYRLSSLGRFRGRRGGGDTVYLNIDEGGAMAGLARLLAERLEKEGFRLEERGFKAHLTLGREITGYEKIRAVSVPSLEIAAEEIALMKSERLGGRLVYTPVLVKKLRHE